MMPDTHNEIDATLKALNRAGVKTAIDDFGTGYSSLSYIKRFNIDIVKIDKSFVMNVTKDAQDQAICEAIVVMAHKLDMLVIAEGIETTEQYELLKSIGCDYAQGYLFSKPVNVDGIVSLLKTTSSL
jgi:EAL domain-containing protein (putative c-di-GMP-specific phosphodiesterase class I)